MADEPVFREVARDARPIKTKISTVQLLLIVTGKVMLAGIKIRNATEAHDFEHIVSCGTTFQSYNGSIGKAIKRVSAE